MTECRLGGGRHVQRAHGCLADGALGGGLLGDWLVFRLVQEIAAGGVRSAGGAVLLPRVEAADGAGHGLLRL